MKTSDKCLIASSIVLATLMPALGQDAAFRGHLRQMFESRKSTQSRPSDRRNRYNREYYSVRRKSSRLSYPYPNWLSKFKAHAARTRLSRRRWHRTLHGETLEYEQRG